MLKGQLVTLLQPAQVHLDKPVYMYRLLPTNLRGLRCKRCVCLQAKVENFLRNFLMLVIIFGCFWINSGASLWLCKMAVHACFVLWSPPYSEYRDVLD